MSYWVQNANDTNCSNAIYVVVVIIITTTTATTTATTTTTLGMAYMPATVPRLSMHYFTPRRQWILQPEAESSQLKHQGSWGILVEDRTPCNTG